MERLSRSSLTKHTEDVQRILGVLHPPLHKKGWVNRPPKHLCALRKAVPAQQYSKHPALTAKPESVSS